jgi:RHS repeat-associated protein
VGNQGATASTYDDDSRLLTLTDPAGDVLTNTYDPFGNVTEEKHTSPGTPNPVTIKDTTTTVDSLGRPTNSTEAISGVGHTWSYPLNTATGVQETQSYEATPLTSTAIMRDARNLESSQATTIASNDVVTRSIDARDSADRWTSASINSSTFSRSFNLAGQLATQSGAGFASGGTYAYDPNTGLKSGENLPLSLGGTISSSYGYDPSGRLQSSSLGGLTSTTFDAANNLKTFIDAGGSATLTYNTNNQLTQMSYGAATTYFGWDTANGWRTWQGPTANPGSIIERHNLLAYPSFEIDSNADGAADGTSFYGSAAGTPVTTIVAGRTKGSAQRLQYGGVAADSGAGFNFLLGGHIASGLIGAGDPATGAVYLKGATSGVTVYLALDYLDASGAKLSGATQAVTVTSSWAQYSVSQATAPANTDHVDFSVYVSSVDSADSVDLTMDDALLEKASTVGSYFDGTSSSTTWEGTPNASDSTLRTAGPPISYAYTSTGRLADFKDTTANEHAIYSYDATGQRTKSVVIDASLATNTIYAYDGITLLSLSASRSDGQSWRIDYLHDEEGTPYGGVYRSPSNASAPIYFTMMATDRGDIVELLDRGGTAFASYRYDEWGNPIATSTTSTALVDSLTAQAIAGRQVLRYAGYAYDSESGLYYCSARCYDPYTRQWTTKDSAKADGEESAYQYCGGNPVSFVDPTGLSIWSTIGRALDSAWNWAYRTTKSDLQWWGRTLRGGVNWLMQNSAELTKKAAHETEQHFLWWVLEQFMGVVQHAHR